MRDVNVAVIGAGQAGLAASFHLKQLGVEHVVLERGRAAESWRSRRWDSFTLVGPNWSFDLPGFAYDGADPDGFMERPEIVARFERYAALVNAPIERGVDVLQLTHDPDANAFDLQTSNGPMRARHVIVATGPYQRARATPAALSPKLHQLHTEAYRHADNLPDGAVLVVGSGQSGCQIVEDLLNANRTVYLATGNCGWLPRRYRGKDNVKWRLDMGLFEQTLEVLPNLHARTFCPPIQTGRGGGHDINLRLLAAQGVVLAGRFVGGEGTMVQFAGDVQATLQQSDEVATEWRRSVDAYIEREGLAFAEEPPDPEPVPVKTMESLDLAMAGVSTVLWATGYRLAFDWIKLDLFDSDGYPLQRQGVSPCPGLYFLGLQWMYKRKSGLIFGVGDDAAHVAGDIASR